MATTSAQAVKQLRDSTGLGMMDCKRILEEAEGDLVKAQELVRQRGLERVNKVSTRAATEGVIEVYLHHNHKLGAMIELNCNTDFVARNVQFQELARELAMHIAAAEPQVVRREELPAALVEKATAELASEPARLEKWFAERALLEQPWVKDNSKTIRQLIEERIAATGENISVRRFSRFRVGESGVDEPAATP